MPFDFPNTPTLNQTVTNGSVVYKWDGTKWVTTAGSPIAAGATGQVQWNNAGALGASANLFWDNTNNRLGIGTSTPLYDLAVYKNNLNPTLRVAADYNSASGAWATIRGDSYSGSASNPSLGLQLLGYSARGTMAAPLATGASDQFLNIVAYGYSGSGWVAPCQIAFNTNTAWTTASTEGYIQFFTTAAGSATSHSSMIITGAGNVGIGTASPGALLDVRMTVSNTPTAILSTSGTGVGLGLYNTYASTASRNWALSSNYWNLGDFTINQSNAQGGNAFDSANTTARLYISAAGNVGIGTTSPGQILTLYKAASGAVGPVLELGNNGAAYGNAAMIQFNDGGILRSQIKFEVTTASGAGGEIEFFTGQPTPAERMRITNNGVIIGQTTISAGLSLSTAQTIAPVKIATWDNGSGAAYGIGVAIGQLTFGASINPSNGTPQMVLTSGGSVGIMTTSPRGTLEVIGTTAITIASASGGDRIYMGYNGYGYINVLNAPNTAWLPLQFQASSFIFYTGNVGLGMSPSYLLHLQSDSAAKPNSNGWIISSDSRLKQNVKPLEGGLPIIKQIVPVEAQYNGLNGTPAGTKVVSVIVEELKKILPGCVPSHRGKLRETDEHETEILDFDNHEIHFHMILAVQELDRRLAKLEKN